LRSLREKKKYVSRLTGYVRIKSENSFCFISCLLSFTPENPRLLIARITWKIFHSLKREEMMKVLRFLLILVFIVSTSTLALGKNQRISSTTTQVSVLPADWESHDVGNVTFSVTRYGAAGFTDATQAQGDGFEYPSGTTNWLFYGALAVGNSPNYVADRHFNPSTGNDMDWETLPGDSLLFGQNIFSEQDGAVHYDDSGHVLPKGITVTQRSWAWGFLPMDDYVILHYTVENRGTSPVDSLYVGQFLDYDLGSGTPEAQDDEAGTVIADRLVYMFDSSSPSFPYVGFRLLDPPTAANLSVINHDAYVYPPPEMADTTKFKFLSGELSFPASDSAYDHSLIASAGPFDLNPGDCVNVAFAILAGDDLGDLELNGRLAQGMYSLVDENTITACEFPTDIGFTQVFYSNGSSPYDLGFLLPGSPPWDFSTGPTDIIDTVMVIRKGGIPHADSFPEAKFVLEGWLEDAGVAAYAFLSKTSDVALWYGGSEGIAIPPVVFNDPLQFLGFPLVVGEGWSDIAFFTVGGVPMMIEENAVLVTGGEVSVPPFSNVPSRVLQMQTILSTPLTSDTTWTYTWIVEDVGVVASASKEGGTSQFSIADEFTRLFGEWVGIEEEVNDEYRTPNIEFRLMQNQPNPFHKTTQIRYTIQGTNHQSPITNHVTLSVYDITGRLVETLVDELQEPGVYQLPFTSNQLPASGIYFYQLSSGTYSLTEKMVILK
jgi:hypothetical protein